MCSIGAPMSTAANSPIKHTAAPERSLNQRMDALQKANVIRTRRAQLKRDLKAGRVSIPALLDPPEFLETAKVFDMLLAVPKYGRVKANKILQTCRISPIEDDRRPLGSSACRARRHAPQVAAHARGTMPACS